MSIVNKFITGYSSGLVQNKKPLLIADQAWQILENAYVFRERVKKREGLKFVGRLRRDLVNIAQSVTTGAGTYQDNDLLDSVRATEPNAEIEPGGLTFKIDPGGPNETIYKDTAGDGVLVYQSGTYTISQGHINYITGQLNLTFTVAPPGGVATNASFHYFPTLPIMGIPPREIAAINDEQTIWFDQKYAYIWNGTAFDEFIPGTTWSSTNSDFFWAFNYRGTNPGDRLFFVTNFISNAANPMRYTDGITWTNFTPLVSATDSLFTCRILVAYYGRLLALNVWEGLTGAGPGAATNIFNRCRFSQLGSPIAADAWRSDQFGKGGFLDAPTNEAIIGATFIKNTLVVTFEQTTWQLRYVGEYGLPFIWERVSADFGSESTFSSVLFDNHMLAVGDKAIMAANGGGVERIDLDIPDRVFQIQNVDEGPKRVFGIRDYQKEIVFWNYVDGNTQAAPGVDTIFPNKVLLYNYRNNTWAIFRDNVTAFGIFQLSSQITWDSTDIFWDDEDVFWDDVDGETLFPAITCGNQQGFVSLYGYITEDEKSLTITGIDLTVSPIVVTSPNHNLQPNEIIKIDGLEFLDSATFLPLSTDLNNKLYQVRQKDANSFYIYKWNGTQYVDNFSFTPVSTALYVGNGTITLFPKLNAVTKDFSLFQDRGLQTKLSSIDFLVEVTPVSAMTVQLYINSNTVVVGNVLVGNTNMSTAPTASFYPPSTSSDYSYYSFYATTVGQFFSINITYDDSLMNNIITHQNKWVLLGINAKCRPAGRMTN